jgi:hypothetical protein
MERRAREKDLNFSARWRFSVVGFHQNKKDVENQFEQSEKKKNGKHQNKIRRRMVERAE